MWDYNVQKFRKIGQFRFYYTTVHYVSLFIRRPILGDVTVLLHFFVDDGLHCVHLWYILGTYLGNSFIPSPWLLTYKKWDTIQYFLNYWRTTSFSCLIKPSKRKRKADIKSKRKRNSWYLFGVDQSHFIDDCFWTWDSYCIPSYKRVYTLM